MVRSADKSCDVLLLQMTEILKITAQRGILNVYQTCCSKTCFSMVQMLFMEEPQGGRLQKAGRSGWF